MALHALTKTRHHKATLHLQLTNVSSQNQKVTERMSYMQFSNTYAKFEGNGD